MGELVPIEVDLFKLFDVDNSGALSRRQLRQLLGLVRTKVKASEEMADDDVPGMDEMLAVLDSKGDGQVSLEEWKANMPDAFKKGLQKLGPAVLQIAQSSSAKGKGSQVKMATDDYRGRQDEAYRKKLSEKKKTASMHDVKVHRAAAESGEVAVEIELFRIYDIDGSGALSRGQLRQLLGLVRTAGQKSELFGGVGVPMPGTEEMMKELDSKGDGQVSLEEWTQNMPEAFRKGVRGLGPSILKVAGSAAAKGGGKGGVLMGGGRSRAEDARAYEKLLAEKEVLKQGFAVEMYAAAAKNGEH
eukprot:SAG22_NODE_4377_length_1287_cov_1.250842_1_plen_300_part_10